MRSPFIKLHGSNDRRHPANSASRRDFFPAKASVADCHHRLRYLQNRIEILDSRLDDCNPFSRAYDEIEDEITALTDEIHRIESHLLITCG